MIALRVSFTRGVFHHSCFCKGVWRCLRIDVDVMGHATSFFQMRGGPHSDLKARQFFFLRRVVGPRFKEARKEMKR